MSKRLLSIVCAATISCAMIFMPNNVRAAVSQHRLWGNDRYETNFKIVDYGWTSSEYAIIASGEGFADALCAAPLAHQYKAPILINGKNTLSEECKRQLSKLNVKKAFIIGGTGVVSDKVKAEVKDMGIEVTRIYGKDRFETSVEVAKNIKDISEVAFTNGYGFADALSMAPIAAQKGMPILLTDKDELTTGTKNFLNENKVKKSYIVGGVGVVSNNISNQLTNPIRLGGNNRYETNSMVLNGFSNEFDYDKVYVASGENYPDALSGSALAALNKSPLILVGNSVDSSVMDSVKSKHDKYKNVIALGGNSVVLDDVIKSISQGIIYFSDKEVLNIINNADKLGYPVVEANNMPVVYFDDKAYQRLEDKFNGEDKILNYLSKSYTKDGSSKIVNKLQLKSKDGVYYKKVGQLGDYPPDILNSKITKKLVSDNKIEVTIETKDLSNKNSFEYKVTLVYDNGKWLVDYWQGLMDI